MFLFAVNISNDRLKQSPSIKKDELLDAAPKNDVPRILEADSLVEGAFCSKVPPREII